MKKILILTLACISSVAATPLINHLERLKIELPSSQYNALYKQCQTLCTLIAQSPKHQQQELYAQLEQTLARTHRSDKGILKNLRELAESEVVPTLSQQEETQQPASQAHFAPIYRLLGVVGGCAAIYLFIVWLQNNRAKTELNDRSLAEHYPAAEQMVEAVGRINDILRRKS